MLFTQNYNHMEKEGEDYIQMFINDLLIIIRKDL